MRSTRAASTTVVGCSFWPGNEAASCSISPRASATFLPHKLRKGRYTIGVMAVDKRFNEARTVVHVRVK